MTRILLGTALVALSIAGTSVCGEDGLTFMPAEVSTEWQCLPATEHRFSAQSVQRLRNGYGIKQ